MDNTRVLAICKPNNYQEHEMTTNKAFLKAVTHNLHRKVNCKTLIISLLICTVHELTMGTVKH